jgi:deoxyribodipyrimidine photo-lyase
VREYADAHKLMVEEFLEDQIVRRELAYNFARYTLAAGHSRSAARLGACDHRRASPGRARSDLHAPPHLRGKIHGYYRIYWGKKILEWSETAEDDLATMRYLHDRYALDGDDPNTYTNILWCFGLHDGHGPKGPFLGRFDPWYGPAWNERPM